jgi:hypothetical protein
MKRILGILLLLILLLDGPHHAVERPIARTVFSVGPQPIWVPIDLAARGYGRLKLFGLWELQSDLGAFGGVSALLVRPDGGFTALSDGGYFSTFGIGANSGDAEMAPLPLRRGKHGGHLSPTDSESLATDPATGRHWIGFEDAQAICRYSADFAIAEACVVPKAMSEWSTRRSIESLVRFSDGRFLAIEEGSSGASGRHDVLLWAGDPVEKGTPPPVHLSFAAPEGFSPTEALWLGGDRLLVLTRRLSLFEGFTAKLVLVRLPKLKAGTVLRGEVIADFRRPGPVDNLEAMALARESIGPVLWVASDDNHLFLQRTLLYRFLLPADWVSSQPAP